MPSHKLVSLAFFWNGSKTTSLIGHSLWSFRAPHLHLQMSLLVSHRGPSLATCYSFSPLTGFSTYHCLWVQIYRVMLMTSPTTSATPPSTEIASDTVQLCHWLNARGFRLNHGMVKAMTVSRKINPPYPAIKLDSHSVEYVDRFKLQGVTINSKLS